MSNLKHATLPSAPGPTADRDPPRRRRVYARKDDIVLEAAERAFLARGFSGTSMDEIAELAGVSKRTVYSNFSSKQALFATVIRERCAEVLPEALDLDQAAQADPARTLEMLAVRFLTAIYAPAQIALYRTVITEAHSQPEIGRIMFEGPITRSQLVFDGFLRSQVALGRMAFPDLRLAASQLIAMLKTNLHMQLLFNQPAVVSHARIARIARASVRLFLHGALTTRAEPPQAPARRGAPVAEPPKRRARAKPAA